MRILTFFERQRERGFNYIMRQRPVDPTIVQLHRRRLYVLPTRYGYVFALMLIIMLLGSINYSNSMGFMLTFLLASLGVQTMWLTHTNLLKLEIINQLPGDTFAGEHINLKIGLNNLDNKPRLALNLAFHNQTNSVHNIPPAQAIHAELYMDALNRGRHTLPVIRIASRYPLGLLEVWTWLKFDHSILVYPQPLPSAHCPLAESVLSGQSGKQQQDGLDDFDGLREYRHGDSLRRIAWKVAARSDQLATKTFSGHGERLVWLDWDQLEAHDTELRLSHLAYWVVKFTEQNEMFGLKLPGQEIQPNQGPGHEKACLKALALFGTVNHDSD